MNLRKILAESFRMLLENPRIFAPKIVSTSISTAWILSFTLMYQENLGTTGVSETGLLYLYLFSAPIIGFLGVFVSVMMADIVKKPGDVSLRRSFSNTLKRWKSLIGVSTGLLLATLLISLPASTGLASYLLTGKILHLAAGAVFTLFLTVVLSYLIFFLPITILEKEKVSKSLKNSLKASRQNSREVTLLLLLSTFLLVLGATMQGTLGNLGLAGFAASRLISAVTTTYLFTVSPKMYIEDNS